MKPKPNMTTEERKAYIEYVMNNDLTPEENEAYFKYLEESEAEFGCGASSIPIEVLREASEEEVWELLEQKRAERRKLNAERTGRV
jgi:hypothetical protein